MEVCYHCVYELELVARRYEESGMAGGGFYGRAGEGFEGSHGRGADCDYSAAFVPGGFYFLGVGGVYPEGLGVNLMVFEVLGGDGLERPGPYMEGYVCKVDSVAAELLHEAFGEVQPGRRRGHRAVDSGVNRLVSQAVPAGDYRVVVTLNIGRQRREAYFFEDALRIAGVFDF